MARDAEIIPCDFQRSGVRKIQIGNLRRAMPLCYRHRLQDAELLASVKQFGILMPIIVTGGRRLVVIAGHRRLRIARMLKMKEVPAIVTEKLKPKDAFLLNLISNWKQAGADLDRARALGKASRELRMKEGDILSVVMPLLGLPEDRSVLQFYLGADQFSESIKDLIEAGHWPFRAITFLFKLSKNDRKYLAQKVGTKVRLTYSQLSQTGEWLADMLKGTGKTLPAFFAEHKVLKGMESPGMDPRAKADLFFTRIKRLRFPGYSFYLEKFEKQQAKILRDIPGLRLEPVQGFEEPGFELRGRVKTQEDLSLLLQKLPEHHSALNSLFEIVL